MYRAVSLESVERRVRWVVLTKPPETKEEVRTHRATVVQAYDGVGPELLRSFAAQVMEMHAVGA